MNNKKKIIRVSTVATSMETFLKGFLKKLSANYEVIAVSSPDKDLDTIRQREGVRTIAVPMERHISIINDIISLFRLIYVFYKERPVLVHSMTPKAGLLSMLAAWVTRVPVRIHTFTGLVFPNTTGFKRKLLIGMDRLTCACATYINPESKGVAKDLSFYHITNKPLHIIANGNVRGVDMNYYKKSGAIAKETEKIKKVGFLTFIFVGRIVGDKGINELVHAFNRLSHEFNNIRLLMIGGKENNLDPLSEKTITIMNENKNIKCYGSQKDVRPFLAAADIFVFPSYREGMPNVVLEAGAMGLPSIVTNINGCNEIIIEGENGEIIPARNSEALYNKMKDWIQNPMKVKKMANKSRLMIENRFEQQMIWKELLKEYEKLIP